MVPIPPTIQEKTRAAISGDSTALGTIFEWYRPRLHAHACRICGNTPLAQDAIQETFIAAFLNYESLRDPSLLYPWLKKILVNKCYRLLSKEKLSTDLDMAGVKDIAIRHNVEQKLERTADNQLVHEVLNQLSDELKACIMLRYFSNFKSYEQISKIMEIPVGTVRSRLAAAREKLVACFRQSADASDDAIRESKKWSNYYSYLWNYLYYDDSILKEFLFHMNPLLNIRFTSGKPAKGRSIIEKMLREDMQFGSYLMVNEVASSGNISIIEGTNINSAENPDHCPATSVVVLFRNQGEIDKCHIFDAPRL